MSNPFGLAQAAPLVDSETLGLATISVEHTAVHNGVAFSLSGTMSLLSGEVGAIAFVVPTGKEMHLKNFSVTTSAGPVTVGLMKKYTIHADASPGELIPVNRKVRSTSAASSVIFTASAVAAGHLTSSTGYGNLEIMVLPGTSAGSSKTGASSSTFEEFELYPDNYIITITNGTSPGATITVGYSLFWYET